MPRAALALVMAAGIAAAVAAAAGVDPHLDRGLLPGGCRSCHRGHGVSRSPMLAGTQHAVCQACHGTAIDLQRAIARGLISAGAQPPLLGSVLALPHRHPLSETGGSRNDGGAVVCTSCHSPHRGRLSAFPPAGGHPLPSTLDPAQLEHELCESCHGSLGATTQNLTDISRLLTPENRSYHPVVAAAVQRSPSLRAELSGAQVNCTDCHSTSDPHEPRGPHGSTIAFLLRAPYTTADGAPESAAAYALCYGCHDRQAVLERSPFPQHAEHIVDRGAACATCHNAHGSVANRALIRFGEETTLAGVSPSASTGRLEFVSEAPGSGACYLTCHAADHAPMAYGAEAARLDSRSSFPPALSPPPRRYQASPRRDSRRPADPGPEE